MVGVSCTSSDAQDQDPSRGGSSQAGSPAAGAPVSGAGGNIVGLGGGGSAAGLAGGAGISGNSAAGGTPGVGGGGSDQGGASAAGAGTGGSGPPQDPGPLSGGGEGCSDVDAERSGGATYYNLNAASPVACGFDLTQYPQPPYWVAITALQFDAPSAQVCGACIEAKGPNGQATQLQVVDRCPADQANLPCLNNMQHLDISPDGLAAVGGVGKIDPGGLAWHFVPCAVQGDVQVTALNGASQFYTAIGVRNHRYRIAKVELVDSTTLMPIAPPLTRRADNFFLVDTTTPAGAAGNAMGPYRLRITDIYGHWIESKVTVMPGQNIGMGLQFPACG
jgi:expansin